MRTNEHNNRRVSRAGVTPWVAPTGFTVLVAMVVTRFTSKFTAVPVGFIISLLIMMALDYTLSAWTVRKRPPSLSVTQTVVQHPDHIRVRVHTPTGRLPIRVLLPRVSLFDRDSDFVTFRSDETDKTIEIQHGSHLRIQHMRMRSEASVLGLVWARQWSAFALPDIYRTSAPASEIEPAAASIDDIGRIRSYVPGDRMNTVSWSATARTGQLHVRAEDRSDDLVKVVVDAGTDFSSTLEDRLSMDVLASWAKQVVDELLNQGRGVELVTTQIVDLLHEEERDAALASPRRRARSSLALGKDGHHTVGGRQAHRFVSAAVYDEIELARRLATLEYGPAVPRPIGAYIEITPAGVRTVS